MNFDQLKKNVGAHVQLEPVACHLDKYGLPLPFRNDYWLVESVGEDGVRILNLHTSLYATLAKDHIYNFTSNSNAPNGQRRGFLTLRVQLFMQGINCWPRPTKPGEALAPPTVEIKDKTVDLLYPGDSGLQEKLNAAGYRLYWSLESHLTRFIDIEGWELVVERDTNGTLVRFRSKNPGNDHVLIKKRN